MKSFLFTIFLISIIFSISFCQNKDDILGTWVSQHGSGKVQFYKQGEKYFGKLVWIKNAENSEGKPQLDVYNPSKELQCKPLLGLEIFKDLDYKSDGTWTDGTVYDPKSGKTYDCKVSMVSDTKLDIRGFKGVSFVGKTVSWSRAE